MEFKDIKGLSFAKVLQTMNRNGLRLWDLTEKKGGVYEIEFIKTHSGVTIESIFVLFGWNGKAMGLRTE